MRETDLSSLIIISTYKFPSAAIKFVNAKIEPIFGCLP